MTLSMYCFKRYSRRGPVHPTLSFYLHMSELFVARITIIVGVVVIRIQDTRPTTSMSSRARARPSGGSAWAMVLQ